MRIQETMMPAPARKFLIAQEFAYKFYYLLALKSRPRSFLKSENAKVVVVAQ